MPGKSSKKNLYLGKSMADLNKLSECKDLGNNVAVLVKSADKTFQEAKHQDDLSDEERAYVLYMRYFNVISLAKKIPDYFKQKEYFDSLIGKPNQLKAIDRAEKLSKSLKERYDLVEAEAVAKKLEALEVSKEEKRKEEEKQKEKQRAKQANGEKKANGSPAETGGIPAMELFSMLNNKELQIIIMDVRSTQDFSDSRINHKSCINVPESILQPGTTVTHISNLLPDASKSLWRQRADVSHVILLDWRSTLKEVKVGTPIQTLRDALYKYDATVKLKGEPLVLQGGYEQWLLFYPTVTTNSHVLCPAKPEDFITSSGLDFDYPDFEEPTAELPPPTNQTLPSTTNGSGLPSVDRSLKPKPGGSSVNEAPLNNKVSESKVNNLKNTNVEPQTDKLDGFSRIENSLYPDVSQISKKSITRNEVKKDTNIEVESRKSRNDSADIERELAELSVIKREKEEELSHFQEERKRMTAEHKARISRLEAEEEKLRKLEILRQKEEKDVAELLRKKRSLQEEIKVERSKQSGEEEKNKQEERLRMADLDRVRLQEDEKRQRQQEVERMRRDRHRKEDEQKKVQEAKDQAQRDAIERERQDEERRKEAERRKESEKEEFLQEEKARQERERQEKERRKNEEERRKNEEERRKKEEQKIQELKKEKQEQEQKLKEEEEARAHLEKEQADKELADRLRHEEAERAKAERDQKLAAEKAQKIAEEKMKKVTETNLQSKKIPTTNLPVGWEKRLDRGTNRYFYINHNQGTTQWEPPAVKQTQPDTYTTKLKEEPTNSTRGLSRSFSSPDIMKQLSEEGDKPFISPNIDRTQKPAQRFESAASRPVQRQYVVKRRDLQPVYGSVGPALTGLRNLGNTCYMNSTIQCLNNCTPLVVYFLNDLYMKDINRESSQGMHGEMVDDYAVVVKALWNGQYRCITPRDLKATVGKYSPMFAGYQQQDSQEFLTFLLDGLHEGLNEVRNPQKVPDQDNDNLHDHAAAELAWKNHKLVHRSIIVELFQGQLKSSLQCKHCSKMSVTFQAFMFLSLPLPNHGRISLKDCLNEFLKPELMTGSCKWKCPRCKVERDAVKKFDLWKLPPILLIGLNRFYSDGMWMSKKTNHVDFPVFDLDLKDYVKDPKSRTKYNLYGISNHYGTMEGGHYTAYCRNPCSKRWYNFDDTEVKDMSASDVKTSAAFVLYYTSIELTAPKYNPQL